jgi:hypothetical protein
MGTRHAAGLGLAERCDALCLVVSEERGTVSIAVDGRLRTLRGTEGLSDALRAHLAALTPIRSPRTRWRGLVERWPEALAALAIAAGLWLVRVPGSDVIEVQRTAPIRIENLPTGFEIESIEPEAVEVTLSGTRWDLFRSRAQPVSVRIDAVLVSLGRRTFRIVPGQVDSPTGVEPLDISPPNVRLTVRQTAATTSPR